MLEQLKNNKQNRDELFSFLEKCIDKYALETIKKGGNTSGLKETYDILRAAKLDLGR